MRIAFIPSAYRTIFFHALVAPLEAAGHEVFWLSPNRRWARWLERAGVASGRILDITAWGRDWTGSRPLGEEESRELAGLEEAGGLRLLNIQLMDPLLVRRSRQRALRYLSVCRRRVSEFLEDRAIRAILGEQTWAFELLVGQVARARGIPHLMPHTVRIPDGRFGFFDGHREDRLVEIRAPADADRDQAQRFLEEFRRRRPQPGYVSVDRSVLRPEAERLRLLLRHLVDLAGDPYDETSRRPLGLVVDQTRQLLRRFANRRLRRFERPTLPPARPYVYFPLHLQPEASIDIKGDPYSNQIEIVRALARTLPATHDLWVKEHAFALPVRRRRFYRDLRSIPGVRLIGPGAGAFELLEHAALTLSITGTAAFEAALHRRPAATVASIFFDPIVEFPRFDPFRDGLGRLLGQQQARVDDEARIEFLARLIARSFPGTVGDALWLPASLEKDNVDQVAAGFDTLLGVLQRGPGEPSEAPPRTG